MSVDRRLFLRGCAGAGLLVAAPTLSAQQLPAPVTGGRLLLLRADGDEAFAGAVRRARLRSGFPEPAMLKLDPVRALTPGALRAALEPHRGSTLLGLTDDCTATLLEECLRDMGAALQCRGQHHGSASPGADSRHLFTTSSAACGVGAAVAATLDAEGSAYLVREQSLSAHSGAAGLPVRALDPHWAQATGSAYALMALGRWKPGAVVTQAGRGTPVAGRDAQPRVSILATL